MSITPYEEYYRYCMYRMPIYNLWRAVLTFVFDRNICNAAHEGEIYKEIHEWNRIVQHQEKIRLEAFGSTGNEKETGLNGNVIDEVKLNIQQMSHLLYNDKEGFLQPRKDLLRVHGIDFRKHIDYKKYFPEAQDPDGKKKGQAALKQAMIDNPEDYVNGN